MILNAITNCYHQVPSFDDTITAIENLINKIIDYVADFFSQIADFFSEAWDFIIGPPDTERQDHIQLPAANLEALKTTLREGNYYQQMPANMTPSDFSALCESYPIHVVFRDQEGNRLEEADVQDMRAVFDRLEQLRRENPHLQIGKQIHFPRERIEIGRWAKDWASNRPIKVDPESPYFEIIQEAFSKRLQIRGGHNSSPNYQDYTTKDQGYYSTANLFKYIILSLTGFQELSRPENVDLFYKLDNLSQENLENNPAYVYATALSKIYTYPRAGDTDIRYKLQSGLPTVMKAYQVAKNQNKLSEFFETCFAVGDLCFDVRVRKSQEFIAQNAEGIDLDFYPKVNHTDSIEVKITRHFETFRNIQIQKYVQRNPGIGTYEEMKEAVVRSGGMIGPQNSLHVNAILGTINADEFATYLQERNQPIRQASSNIHGLTPLHNIRFVNDRASLTVDRQGVEWLREGREVALKDQEDRWFKAKVDRIDVGRNQITFDLRGDPIPRAGANGWEQLLDARGLI
jgi:hypothetical protein